jgi:ribosomal protein L18E
LVGVLAAGEAGAHAHSERQVLAALRRLLKAQDSAKANTASQVKATTNRLAEPRSNRAMAILARLAKAKKPQNQRSDTLHVENQ